VTKAGRIGIDSYGLDPLGLDPLGILEWGAANGAEGVHFSGLSPRIAGMVDDVLLKDLAQAAAAQNMFVEWGGGQHIPFDTETWEGRDTVPINHKAAEQAALLGTRIVRSCSGGLMRWRPESPKTETLLQETATSLRSQRKMLKDHNVILAIETHFEFTTHELLRLFAICEAEPGDYLGICFDTMNVLTMLEDPLEALERILPWVVCTHAKDGGLLLSSKGLMSFPAEIGKGVVNFPKIFERIQSLPHEVHFSVEDHGGSFTLPVFEAEFLREFPDLSLQEFEKLIHLARETKLRVEGEGLAVTDRKDWPDICESRMKRDLFNLRKILG
jgi:sugar phosphate isomerase/epimerase